MARHPKARPQHPQHHPDLGADGPAARARPVVETVVRTRDHAKVVAVQVLTLPLDVYHHSGRISDREHEAGTRLAKALRSWQAASVTARLPVASDPGLDDEDDNEATDEDRHAARKARAERAAEAERIVGRELWPVVKAVAEGYWLGRLTAMVTLRRGLGLLADGWKLPGDRG